MKRIFTLLIIATMFAISSLAYDVQIDGIYYNLNDETKTAEVTYQTDNSSDNYSGITSITIPEKVTYNSTEYSVTSIGDYAFYGCKSLKSITIPNSVTSIGSSAFYYCYNLTSITIPNSVTSIGDWAFENCSSLTSITIGNSVTSIGNQAFSSCSSLTSITIPNSVTSIGYGAFEGCSSLTSIEVDANNPNYASIDGVLYDKDVTTLIRCPCGKTSITIPNSVTSIGNYAFSFCSSLTSIEVDANNPNYASIDGVLYDKDVTTLICCPGGKTSITIPNSVTSIGNQAFFGCSSLISITIPNSVTSIGNQAFYWCSSLTSITIPNSVTSIGYGAFEYCSSLTFITIGNSVISIEQYAFANCSSLTSINIEATIPPTIGGANTFKNVSKNIPVTVPCGSLSAYQSANYWSEFTNFRESFPYTFSATTADATMGSVTIETAPTCGVDAVIKATPNDDYRFMKWSDGNTENPRTITVTEDITLTAIFEVIKFHVSVTCNNPTMGMVLFTSGTNDTDYEKGANVSFVAITNSGYLFNGWSDGVKDVFRTIVITQDTTITALFGTNTCSLTLNANETMGSVTGSGTYTKGTNATIVATPNDGYRFVKWSDGNTNATRSIVVNEDMTLSAIFEKIPTCTINVTANAQMGSATGGGTFEIGKTTTLSAIANEGYHFVKWSDGITTNPRTITVTENLSLEAIFEALYPNWSFDDDKPSSTEHTFLGKEYYDTITIVAGKTITIEDNAIIACNDIVIKADENGNVPEIKIEGDIIANNGITFEWEIDDSRWYFFTLPFNCKISDIEIVTIANGPSDGVWNYYNPQDGSGNFIIRDYNQKRAAQGQGKKTGWVDCEANKMLHKGRGYIIGLFPAGSKAKVHFKSEKQIQLSKFIEHELDFGEEHSWYDYAEGDNQLYNGWNLVGVPYFETFSQGDLDAAYVSIPNDDGTTYTQHTLAEALTQGLLRPFMSFFIQLAENVAPTFDPTDRSNAPMLRAKQNAEGGEIVINILNAEDKELCDRTTIINNTSKTNDYEIGYDLQKMIGYAAKPQIYTIEECGILAFNAQDVLSSGIVRLGLYIPADGEYVIGGESWGKLSGAELYDNETGVATSLTIPQTIYFTKGTYNERFEIRVKQQTTTDVDVIDNDCDVYIENGRLVVENMPADGNVYVYDTTGKLILQQSTNSNINVEIIAEGIYHITIHTENNQVINTKIVY